MVLAGFRGTCRQALYPRNCLYLAVQRSCPPVPLHFAFFLFRLRFPDR